MKTDFVKSIGFKVFLFYLFFTYIVQIFFHLFFYDKFQFYYNGANVNPLWIILFLIVYIFLVIAIDSILPHIKIKKKFSLRTKKVLNFFGDILIFLFFISSIYFALHYDISFRHHHRMRETGVLIQIMFFLKEFIFMYVFFQFFKVLNGHILSFQTNFRLIIILISWLLTVTSSLNAIMVMIILSIIFSKKFHKILLKTYDRLSLKIFFFYLLFLCAILLSVMVGIINKKGLEETFNIFNNKDLIYNMFSMIITRVSSSYASLLELLDNYFIDLDLYLQTLTGFFHTFLNRLSIAIPFFDYHLQGIETVNRENFIILYTSENFLERAGASPGLLASIFYTPLIFPVNFIYIIVYTILIIRVLNNYIKNYLSQQCTLICLLILYYFITHFFEAPLDIFYIINPTNITIFMYLLGRRYYNEYHIIQKENN